MTSPTPWILIGALPFLALGCGTPDAAPPAGRVFKRFDPAEVRRLDETLRSIRFPCLKEELWRRLELDPGRLKPEIHALTTGTFWDYYQLADDTFLILNTLFDDDPDVELWYDGWLVTRIPDHPWE